MLIVQAVSSLPNNRVCNACQHAAIITMPSASNKRLITVPVKLLRKFNVVTYQLNHGYKNKAGMAIKCALLYTIRQSS